MAQHDQVISNANGATVRADFNSALAALFSNSSGSSAPATTLAYQLWADTTSGLLKIRNAANSAWIDVGTLAGTNLGLLSLAGGTMTGALNFAQGSDVASAGTINLTTATGNVVDVTGTTTITAVTLAQGAARIVRFTGALTLTHGSSLVLPTAANITTAAGDYAVFVGYSAGVVRCVSYQRASGLALALPDATESVKGAVELATAAETVTGTDAVRALTAAGFAGNNFLGADGYYRFPVGFTIQWGTVTVSPAGASVTFPTAFTELYSIVISPGQTLADSTNPPEVRSPTTSGFTGGCADATYLCYWQAFGRKT